MKEVIFLNLYLTNSSTNLKMDITVDKLGLSSSTLESITKKGFKVATEIQAKIIPLIFEQKKDIIGIAQTGTGKTGAFGLPLIDMINKGNKLPQAIILAPTRELALQVTKELNMFSSNKKLNIVTMYGGASITPQINSLKKGVDIVVGTPGRILDLINRKELKLSQAKYFILDEADEMLKMGFIDDIELILDCSSKERMVYLFSATMPDRIKKLSKKYMKNQEIVEAKKRLTNKDLIEQSFYKVKQSEKFDVLNNIINAEDFFYGIIFCRTKADVDNITSLLKKSGNEVDCIHGDIQQSKREKILDKFRNSKINILVATDVAARGIDVANLSHVINFNLPEDVETYTHRIGRTGRAGNKGKAISLITPGEMRRVSLIEKELGVKIESKKVPSKEEVKKISNKKILTEIDNLVGKVNTENYNSVIEDLLKKHKPEKVIGVLLYKLGDGKENNKDNEKKLNLDGDTRIFIAKGKFDNMEKRSLIRFIEKETRVKLGDVSDVKVCDKFSFLTMDSNTAHKVVKAFESKNRRRPLAEIADR